MRIDKNWVFFTALFATIFFGCKNDTTKIKYTYVGGNGQTREEQFTQKVNYNDGHDTTYFLNNKYSTMKFFFQINRPDTSRYASGSDTSILEYLGYRNYTVSDKTYKVEGYINLNPQIDASEGIFFNKHLGILHIVSYSWGNYLFLSSSAHVSDEVLLNINHLLMEDSTFYFKHRYPLPPPPK